jgi:DNA-binding transcriptional MerR regulator
VATDDDLALPAPREYRISELAMAAGLPLRTVRFYRERKLLPPPRREGRIAWYNEHHLARLRTITALLERGHTLGGIAELMAAWDSGRHDVGDILGLGPAPGWSEETAVRLTPEGLADYYEGEVSAENLAAALESGYIAIDGDDVVHVSRRLLEASSALVREGIPLADVLAAGHEVRARLDAVADLFVRLARVHVLPGKDIAEAATRLRPLLKGVVEAELALAMDRRLREELDGTRRPGGGPPEAG